MKNKKLFDKTIGILVNAYMKGALKHCHPCACGIGNIIVANNNYKMTNHGWRTQGGGYVRQEWYHNVVHGGGDNDQILSTGYSSPQLKTLEAAFEDRNTNGMIGERNDPTGYKGLMRMVDVFIDIHKGDEAQKLTTKELFPLTIEGHGR